MTCGKTRRLIQAYVDGAASKTERESVESHVAACAGCAAVLAESRQLVSLLAGMPERAVSDEFDRNLMTAARYTAPVSQSAAWWERFRLRFEWRLRVPAMVAAGSLAAGVVAALVVPQLGMPEGPQAPLAAAPERGRFVASAVERHRELEQSNPNVEWDAVNSSIDLSTGSVITE